MCDHALISPLDLELAALGVVTARLRGGAPSDLDFEPTGERDYTVSTAIVGWICEDCGHAELDSTIELAGAHYVRGSNVTPGSSPTGATGPR